MQSFGGEIENAVKLAIDSGYRLIDTAWAYENEAEIGKAIRTKIAQGVVKRTDLFIVNKVRQTIVMCDLHNVNAKKFILCS